MRFAPCLTAPAIVTLLAACGTRSITPSGDAPPLDALPRALTPLEQQLVTAGRDFSVALFRQASTAGARDSSVFLSPLSASVALGMTMNGAAGATFDAMRATLGLAAASQDEINRGYQSLTALLRGLDARTDIRLASAVWYRAGIPFDPTFLATTRTFFDAEVQGLDFRDATASLRAINGWVDQRTAGRITRIVEQIDPNEVMFLVNAIYFKGVWRTAFDPAETRDATFRPRGGGTQAMRLMHRQGTMRYLETPQFQMVDLPYGNGAFTMTVLLPAAGSDVDALVGSLSSSTWASWTMQLREQTVDLSLPKFRLEYSRVLNDDLKALGMGIVFSSPPADFSRMSPLGRDLYITYVKQKTYVDVSEEGTEAAGVTVGGVGITAAPAVPTMTVDRPFVFVIRERFSNTILFIGRIVRLP